MLKKDIIVKRDEYYNDMTISLTDILNDNKFTGSLESYTRTLLIETYILNQYLILEKNIRETNIKIVDYLKSKNKLTYDLFEICLLKSKIMQGLNIPYEIIKEKATIVVETTNILIKIGKKKELLNVL